MLKLRRNESPAPAGFSLPELLIVIVMAGILALIATPSWLAMVNNRRASTVRDTIVQGIRLAQDRAERERVPVSVTLRTAQPLTIRVQGQAEERLIREGIPPNSVTVNTVPAPTNNQLTLTYNATGALDQLPATPTRILVTVGNSRRCIVLENLLGAMRTVEPNTAECPRP